MSGKGCWLPQLIKKPSLVNLSPGAHRIIRRLENRAWKEAGTGQASEAGIKGWAMAS